MEHGPDRLPTDESEQYDPDSADEAVVPIEMDDEEEADFLVNKLLLPEKDPKISNGGSRSGIIES
jgi:hypothetical protein